VGCGVIVGSDDCGDGDGGSSSFNSFGCIICVCCCVMRAQDVSNSQTEHEPAVE
jgi:hypothetical protein